MLACASCNARPERSVFLSPRLGNAETERRDQKRGVKGAADELWLSGGNGDNNSLKTNVAMLLLLRENCGNNSRGKWQR
jgi:hypothetical protein